MPHPNSVRHKTGALRVSTPFTEAKGNKTKATLVILGRPVQTSRLTCHVKPDKTTCLYSTIKKTISFLISAATN
jgi:hypothetical protein